ncbi:MAG TPA: hypothetical protein VH477_04110, partial [Bryobacteraceae bacterium]
EMLEIAIQQWAWERNDAARPAGLLSALTNYVMPRPEPYERWTKRILARLEGLYPRDPRDQLGDVVPREALDPDVDFRVEDTERLINRFLAGLDYRSSPFLSSPGGMLEPDDAGESFNGTPYVFDMVADRQSRLSK